VIFINNKDKFDHTATISYVYDPQYYDLNVVRKVRELRSCKQNKEEVQIRWKDKMDFDSMIEVKLCVQTSVLNSKEIKFLLPTMFIEFTNRKPEFYYRELYEKTTITPIYQFSSIYLAQDIIPF
jgi:CRISPR/Cas system-associated endonuclease/helicase Cas3